MFFIFARAVFYKGHFMAENEFERKSKEEYPVLAICYDFDKTLSPENMQAQGYIQSVGFDIDDFWTQSNELAEKNNMDQNSAWMYKMMQEAKGKNVFTKETFERYGSELKLFPGLPEWFGRIKDYAKPRGVIVEHYIISSGLKEMIEATAVCRGDNIEKVFASSFYFDQYGVAVWPAQIVNYTNKTQFLFRIEKGVLDINDPSVNDYFPPEKIRVPFKNIVYIGDSDTDIPCMKLVNSYGGHAIAVYDPDTEDKTKAYRMFSDNRIKYFAAADYRAGSELDGLIKTVIDSVGVDARLDKIYFKKKLEVEESLAKDERSLDERAKDLLIEKLAGSDSFRYTHQIIKELQGYSEWSATQQERLYEAAVNNNQVGLIINDYDIRIFFESLLARGGDSDVEESALAKIVRAMLEG